MFGLDTPWLLLTSISFIVDLTVLGVLYWLLPTTEKTSQLRYVLRFAVLWAIGEMGHQWSVANNLSETVLRIVSEIVSLVAMTLMSALWTQLAWRTVLDIKHHKDLKALDNYQIGIYVGSVAFIGLGFATRRGYELLPQPYMAVFQVWFMACLAWSVARFLGPSYKTLPQVDRKSRILLATGTATMFFFVLIDLLQALTIRVNTELTSGLQFVPMALIGWAFLIKRKYMIAPSVKGTKGSKTLGVGTRLRPGRVYLELGGRPGGELISPSDILRGQVRQGRPVLLITEKDPKRYRMVPKLRDLPLVHFIPEGTELSKGSDLTSEEILEMVGYMAKEFALEAWLQDTSANKDRGAVVLIDGLSVLFKTAGTKGAKAFLKALREDVRGSDQLCLVLFGDGTTHAGMARTLKKYTRPLRKGRLLVRSNR
jgi:hypothetical protein